MVEDLTRVDGLTSFWIFLVKNASNHKTSVGSVVDSIPLTVKALHIYMRFLDLFVAGICGIGRISAVNDHEISVFPVSLWLPGIYYQAVPSDLLWLFLTITAPCYGSRSRLRKWLWFLAGLAAKVSEGLINVTVGVSSAAIAPVETPREPGSVSLGVFLPATVMV